MAVWKDLAGTLGNYLRIGLAGVRLKNSSGNLLVRNADDSADAAITASAVNVSGNSIVVNSDAAESGADWKITLARPTSGMTANYTLTWPVSDGSPDQVIATDGSGNLSFVAAGSTLSSVKVDTTTIVFGDTGAVAAFTLPANAVVHSCKLIVDTAFDGTAPTAAVGISGTTGKYMSAAQNDLQGTAGDSFETFPTHAASGSTEAIIVTVDNGSATAGSVRVEVSYSTPA